MNSKLTAEGIMGAAMRMGAELSGSEFPISVFPLKIQRIISDEQIRFPDYVGR